MTTNVAIACQGGGSHTAFTAGVLGGAGDEPVPRRERVERAARGAADADEFVLIVPVTLQQDRL